MSERDQYNPHIREGRREIELSGQHHAEELALLDIIDKEVIQDEALLNELAKREFDLWLAGKARRNHPNKNQLIEASDFDEVQRIFVESFCKGYTNSLDNHDLDGRQRANWRRRVSLRAVDDPKVRKMRFPDFMSEDASFFHPDHVDGIENIKKHSRNDGSVRANQHRPDAIITDEQELRALATRECDKWFGKLENIEVIKDELTEIKRIYVNGFTASYKEYIDLVRKNDERKAAKDHEKALPEDGARITIINRNEQSDGVVYEVEFIDPDRMTQAVSFGVSVADDGVVELQEL